MKWDPSVRARHLTIIIALVLASAGTLTAFNLSRLLHGTVATARERQKLAADYLAQAAQEAIYRNPQQDFQLTIKEDPTINALLRESSGEEKYFAYLAIPLRRRRDHRPSRSASPPTACSPAAL